MSYVLIMVPKSFLSELTEPNELTVNPMLTPFRRKISRECYRCMKGIILTRSFQKPVAFALSQIPKEISSGYLNSISNQQTGENLVGYVSTIGFIRFVYRVTYPSKLKSIFRVMYNMVCLPFTSVSFGMNHVFDAFRVSDFEALIFGEPIYIFNDKRLWIERNFTLGEAFNATELKSN